MPSGPQASRSICAKSLMRTAWHRFLSVQAEDVLNLRISNSELILLLEVVVREVGGFAECGVWFSVDAIETTGTPIRSLRAWATLRYLPAGSPFRDYFAEEWVRSMNSKIEKELQFKLDMRQSISIDWVYVGGVIHAGVKFTECAVPEERG